ncbi:MAG TPA: T9SS type A sorting domain-containing protein [Edaphocola sp.]|nr:T9SS type A sorting domain-containing protein [Edaphocola sp.]
MKKSFIAFALLLGTAFGVQAQTPVIANGSFETWTTEIVPAIPPVTIDRPKNWYGSDVVLNKNVGPLLSIAGLSFTNAKQVSKSTDSHEGVYAAKLMTKFYGDTLKNLPCLLTNAKQDLNMSALLSGGFNDPSALMNLFKFTNGTPIFMKRIDSVTAYVKTPSTNIDSAAAFVTALKNYGVDSSIPIGQGGVMIPANTGGYVKISIPVAYFGDDHTDTMIVGFSSAGMAGGTSGYALDNTLYVDKVEVYTSEATSVTPIPSIDLGYNVYPNPASTVINFNNKNNQQANTLIILNNVGKIMHFSEMANGNNSVDLNEYTKGIYFYEIYNEKGTGRQTGKFIK